MLCRDIHHKVLLLGNFPVIKSEFTACAGNTPAI